MSLAIFNFNGTQTTIQCTNNQKMKDICQKFATKAQINFEKLFFIYGGNIISDFELSFGKIANSIDLKNNKINILAYEQVDCEKKLNEMEKNKKLTDENVRDIIQSSFVNYRKNLDEDFYINKNKKKRKSLLDEEDPFGFEIIKQEKLDCEWRQIQYLKKLNLDNDTNCEIRLIDFENDKNPKFYKLYCGEEYIEKNINFIKNWYNNNLTKNDIGIYLN